jgi:hypothetical protein
VHDVLVAIVFIAMVFSPAVVAAIPKAESEDDV